MSWLLLTICVLFTIVLIAGIWLTVRTVLDGRRSRRMNQRLNRKDL